MTNATRPSVMLDTDVEQEGLVRGCHCSSSQRCPVILRSGISAGEFFHTSLGKFHLNGAQFGHCHARTVLGHFYSTGCKS